MRAMSRVIGALACVSQCPEGAANASLGLAGAAAITGIVGLFVHELFKDVSLKH